MNRFRMSLRCIIGFARCFFQWERVGTPFRHLFCPDYVYWCILVDFIWICNTNCDKCVPEP